MTKLFDHYVLFGPVSAEQYSRLVLTRLYLARFGPAFGFDLEQAAHARTVTIVGDERAVPEADEARLRSAGCRIERWLGDDYAVEAILRDRLERDCEFA